MWIAAIWRYPVKSMGGEPLRSARLGPDGVAGDRVVHVATADGRVVTARIRPALLGLHATLGPDGEPLVDGRPWQSPEVARDVRRAAGDEARLVRFDGVERFDVLPLLVATDGAIEAFGHDGRRLRPNIVIGGVAGLAERGWEGRQLRLGSCLIAARDLRARCVMTTFDPDTQAQDPSVLRGIVDRFGGTLALNCEVLRGGTIAVGDPVELKPVTPPGGQAPG
jgi:uncharacterized protein YcbX